MAGKDYVVGKGEVHFDQFAEGTKTKTGERYMGNTPEFSISQDQSTLDHFDSDSGLNVKDESIVTEQNMTGSLVTDNISIENVAAWFGGEVDAVAVAGATLVPDAIANVKLGRTYQIGATEDAPQGARNISTVVVTKGVTVIAASGNFEVDGALGRIYIEEDAADIDADDDLTLTYTQVAGTQNTIIAKGTVVQGALRFISKNPVGSQKDYYFPFVKLTANGDFALKGDEWQQIPFSIEVLKLDANTERAYITQR